MRDRHPDGRPRRKAERSRRAGRGPAASPAPVHAPPPEPAAPPEEAEEPKGHPLYSRAEVLAALPPVFVAAPGASQRVYVNRDLRLDRIACIGFDMDYSLAIYRESRFEAITFRNVLHRLVKLGYPASCQGLVYDPRAVIRGLVVDKSRGNVLKIERYNYVGRGFHGSTPLPKEVRRAVYGTKKISLRSPHCRWIDTLFEVPEVNVYCQMIDLLERAGTGAPVDYAQLYDDVRRSMDEAHADPTVKGEIVQNPGRFIDRDPHLPALLHRFRSSGKRLFLLTNSAWEYTHRIMSYLLDRALDPYPVWTNYFDLVVVSAKKPQFFQGDTPFRTPENLTRDLDLKADPRAPERVLEGGNLAALEERLQARPGAVLFVGDHIYGDILRSKKATLWRTAMIIPELEAETAQLGAARDLVSRLRAIEERRRRLDDEINFHRTAVRELERIERSSNPVPPDVRTSLRKGIDNLTRLRATLKEVVREAKDLEDRTDRTFNENWGMLFREGNDLSRFGEQVKAYACIYTSRVTNLGFYSPNQYFRAPPQELAHERAVLLE